MQSLASEKTIINRKLMIPVTPVTLILDFACREKYLYTGVVGFFLLRRILTPCDRCSKPYTFCDKKILSQPSQLSQV